MTTKYSLPKYSDRGMIGSFVACAGFLPNVQTFKLVFLKDMIANVTERNRVSFIWSVIAQGTVDAFIGAQTEYLLFCNHGHGGILT